ncbi:Lrp/AsnC family transcriptional regulator [Caballeronia sp. LZ019]|uniref:Lrp/AsnC family transcriptional regulator n=1 Tax=Caballeronia sp. LZ019 TaxID=3038555 RepID=UPI002866D975|nr:Lrp/AsnC family transcriptional regulator [Caballeronia sp. LZ019]MDR5809254.1 Lrp/AsnC family transcriptional regulator [Caballeronia sp. LZ019]
MATKFRPSRTLQNVELDAFDLQILAIVQRNNQTPHREIGLAVNLSVPSVARRLQKLRSVGVIAADRSVLNPDALGSRVTIITHVSAESEAIELLDAMKARFDACEQVQQCYYVTGDVDFILIFCTRDMAEYTALTRSLFFAEGNVRSFRTFVAMERVKTTLHVPVA